MWNIAIYRKVREITVSVCIMIHCSLWPVQQKELRSNWTECWLDVPSLAVELSPYCIISHGWKKMPKHYAIIPIGLISINRPFSALIYAKKNHSLGLSKPSYVPHWSTLKAQSTSQADVTPRKSRAWKSWLMQMWDMQEWPPRVWLEVWSQLPAQAKLCYDWGCWGPEDTNAFTSDLQASQTGLLSLR